MATHILEEMIYKHRRRKKKKKIRSRVILDDEVEVIYLDEEEEEEAKALALQEFAGYAYDISAHEADDGRLVLPHKFEGALPTPRSLAKIQFDQLKDSAGAVEHQQYITRQNNAQSSGRKSAKGTRNSNRSSKKNAKSSSRKQLVGTPSG
jgi:hypothetical protein